MIRNLQDCVVLDNGVKMPGFGLGVFQVENGNVSEPVQKAIELGYRSIDTAAIYGNEQGVGEGIKAGLKAAGIRRDDLFVTSKVWNDGLSYEETKQAYYESLNKLGLDYLDLYLVHWPGANDFHETWRAMEDLFLERKVRAIGVCNFNISHLEDLLGQARVTPALNQIELHPCLSQKQVRDYCTAHGILIEAWAPLMQGKLLNNQVIAEIAQKHKKTAAQVILRWDIQNGIITIPKSVKPERILSNADVFDFALSQEEMTQLDALNTNKRVGPDPDAFRF